MMLQMLLDTGLLVTVVVNKSSADVEKIFIDRSLVNLTLSTPITDGVLYKYAAQIFLTVYRIAFFDTYAMM
jgi:hypothetical protein